MGRLEGKAAIIAGGSKGIGYAISTTFAREGASVAVVGSNAEAAEKTAQEIRDLGGTAIAVAADLTSEEGRALSSKRRWRLSARWISLSTTQAGAASPHFWKRMPRPLIVPST